MHGVEHLGFAFCPNCAIIEALSTLFRRLLLWALYFLHKQNITLKDGDVHATLPSQRESGPDSCYHAHLLQSPPSHNPCKLSLPLNQRVPGMCSRFDERTMSLTRRRSVASDRPDTLDIPGRAPPCQRMASCSCETMLLVEGRPTGTEPGRRRSVKAEAFLRDGLKEEDHLWVNVVIISQTTSRRRPNDSAANHP
ncbi:hypothetical protein OPV22_005469 [Ensete ventricosum]|uniref:Uncharacterized protein n=1 Tax=Ensete ventricosum TaxID=4639 RepID=A0AAV8RR57_ENSVE|nr:hypothetical protein OPV22_005469 [Ensete ventricosum]